MRKTDVTQHSLYSYRAILANMKSCKVRFGYHQIRRIRHAGHSCPRKTEK